MKSIDNNETEYQTLNMLENNRDLEIDIELIFIGGKLCRKL